MFDLYHAFEFKFIYSMPIFSENLWAEGELQTSCCHWWFKVTIFYTTCLTVCNVFFTYRALRDLFYSLHADSSKFHSNTSLVLTNYSKFGFDFKEISKVSVPYVVLDKNCKQMKVLSEIVNEKGESQLVNHISDWSEHLISCDLFKKVMAPNCFMLCVDGWIVNHCNVTNLESGDDRIQKVFTMIGKSSL